MRSCSCRQHLHGQQDGVAAADAAREHEQHEQGALGREESGGKEGGSAAGSSRVASGLEISLKRAHVAAANRLHALQVQLVDAAAEAVAARACRGVRERVTHGGAIWQGNR